MNSFLKSLERPAVVYGLIVLLAVAYLTARMTLFSGLSDDETEKVLFAMSGKSVGLVLALKYVILSLIYVILYQAAQASLSWFIAALVFSSRSILLSTTATACSMPCWSSWPTAPSLRY